MAAINAAFQNVKWEKEMEKGVNQRWKYFKSKIGSEKKVPLRERKKPNPKARKQIPLWEKV